jgi:hypothetical protein
VCSEEDFSIRGNVFLFRSSSADQRVQVIYALARPFMLRQAQHERRKALLMRFDRFSADRLERPFFLRQAQDRQGERIGKAIYALDALARPFILRQAQHERREALLMRFDRLTDFFNTLTTKGEKQSGESKTTPLSYFLFLSVFGRRLFNPWKCVSFSFILSGLKGRSHLCLGASVHTSTGSV